MTDEVSESRKLAVVTGASSGIGYELARCCAEAGFDLVIAADEPTIENAARSLRQWGSHVEAFQVDLATPEGVSRLYTGLHERVPDVLMAPTGHGLGRGFLDQNFDEIRHVIDTNITGTVDLVQRIGRDMKERGVGRILIADSIAGFVPGVFQAVYNGAKAFIDSFSLALRAELKDSGVTVTSLMLGAMETNVFARAGSVAEKELPADVAKAGFEAMMRGDGDVVTGSSKMNAATLDVAPVETAAEWHRSAATPGSAVSAEHAR